MIFSKRKNIENPRMILEKYADIEANIFDITAEFPNFTTNLDNKFFAEQLAENQKYELIRGSIRQLLSIGSMSIKTFDDNKKTIVRDIPPKVLDARIYMLNSVKYYADKEQYKYRTHEDKVIGVVNPKYPSFNANTLVLKLYDYLQDLDLNPKLVTAHYEVEEGYSRYEIYLDSETFAHNVEEVPLNANLQMGFRISNSNTGNGHFKLSLSSYQKVCSNGLIAPVKLAGLELLHRTEYDMVSKIKAFIRKHKGGYAYYGGFNEIDQDSLMTDFVEAIVSMAKNYSNVIAEAYKEAHTKLLTTTANKHIEAIGRTHKMTKTEMSEIQRIYRLDETIDRVNPSMGGIVNAISRYANHVKKAERQEQLQEIAYLVATA